MMITNVWKFSLNAQNEFSFCKVALYNKRHKTYTHSLKLNNQFNAYVLFPSSFVSLSPTLFSIFCLWVQVFATVTSRKKWLCIVQALDNFGNLRFSIFSLFGEISKNAYTYAQTTEELLYMYERRDTRDTRTKTNSKWN